MTPAEKAPQSSLGATIRAKRIAKGLSQAELAACAGLTAPGVSRIETGRIALPRESGLKALARCLDLNAGELLELSGWTGIEVHESEHNAAVGRMVANFDEKRREIVNLLPVLSDTGVEMVLSHLRWVLSDERKKNVAGGVDEDDAKSVG